MYCCTLQFVDAERLLLCKPRAFLDRLLTDYEILASSPENVSLDEPFLSFVPCPPCYRVYSRSNAELLCCCCVPTWRDMLSFDAPGTIPKVAPATMLPAVSHPSARRCHNVDVIRTHLVYQFVDTCVSVDLSRRDVWHSVILFRSSDAVEWQRKARDQLLCFCGGRPILTSFENQWTSGMVPQTWQHVECQAEQHT